MTLASRSRCPALLGSVLLAGFSLACQQANPDFDEPTGEERADDDSDSDDDAGEVCELQGGETPLAIKIDQPCGHNIAGETEYYEYWFQVTKVSGSSFDGFLCEPGDCSDCPGPSPPTVEAKPLPFDELFAVDDCLHVRARQAALLSCEYEALAIWRHGEVAPVVLARDGDLSVPLIAGNAAWSSFEPELEVLDDCPCEEVDSPCCEVSGVSPTLYGFELPGTEVVVAPDDIDIVEVGGETYDFWALDAFSQGGPQCNERLNVSWALIR